MVSVHNDLGVLKIRSELLHCIQDHKQVLFSYCIILLGLIQCSTGIIDRFLALPLPQDCPYRTVAGITHDLKKEISMRWLNDGGRNQSLLTPAKGFIALISKYKRGVFGQMLS